jgi:hypothetical protein
MCADIFVVSGSARIPPPPPKSSFPDDMALLQIPDRWGNTHSFFRFSKHGGHLGPW